MNKEKALASLERKRIARRRKNNNGTIPKCQFCGRVLTSQHIKKKHWKYCSNCKEDPEVRAHLRALYMARWYAKKKGHEQPSLILCEDTIQ